MIAIELDALSFISRVLPISFIYSLSVLCSLMLNPLLLSQGYGQSALESLAGKIGSQDVQDMLQATQEVIQLQPALVDGARVGLLGGSHGGFLTAHLSARYAEVYKVAALRNPVINIPAMYTSSDISDWCVVEALGPGHYNFEKCEMATLEQIQQMHAASPAAFANGVRAPTLLCLGAKDRRVPFSQGMEYYNFLKAKGVKVGLRLYPEDCHSIDKPASEADQFVAIRNWISEHI